MSVVPPFRCIFFLQLQVLKINLNNFLTPMQNEKVRELSQKISETRAAVAAVKMTIDGMRSTRDEQMAQMSSLKVKLREQNQRLVVMSQEKMRMDARNKANAGSGEADFKFTLENKRVCDTRLGFCNCLMFGLSTADAQYAAGKAQREGQGK
jgi:hypothetical protein